jgi:hypothetical protein
VKLQWISTSLSGDNLVSLKFPGVGKAGYSATAIINNAEK